MAVERLCHSTYGAVRVTISASYFPALDNPVAPSALSARVLHDGCWVSSVAVPTTDHPIPTTWRGNALALTLGERYLDIVKKQFGKYVGQWGRFQCPMPMLYRAAEPAVPQRQRRAERQRDLVRRWRAITHGA